MHRVQLDLPDEAYSLVVHRAKQEGFGSPEVYLTELIVNGVKEQEDLDHLFTPDIIARLDAAAEEARFGKHYSRSQLDTMVAENKAKWLENNGS